MKRALLVLSISLAAIICFSAESRAVAGFQRLQALVGDWEGKDSQRNAVKTNFKTIASNTAVMETLSMPGMDEMVTLYSIDGDAIALVHYCPTNNQPRMRAIPPPGDIKELVFSFVGAGNLPNPATGHEHKLVMEFQDKDHITEKWTWRKNGKDTEMIFHFARANRN